MSLTAQQILFISHQYTIYVTLFLLIGGIIGNILNLLIFTTSKIFRGNQCVLLLIIVSIVDNGQIIITLSSRILTDAFGVDPAQRSLIWCRLRAYIAQALTLISNSTICFLAFDQFLSTSYKFYLKNFSTLKLTRRYLSITICFSLIDGIPLVIYLDLHPIRGCNIYNAIYVSYYTYFYFIGLIAIIPALISSIFSLLAFYNIDHIIRRQISVTRRQLDQQFTIMALLRTICFISLSLPYIIYRIYSIKESTADNTPMKTAIISLVGAFANSLII